MYLAFMTNMILRESITEKLKKKKEKSEDLFRNWHFRLFPLYSVILSIPPELSNLKKLKQLEIFGKSQKSLYFGFLSFFYVRMNTI